MEVDMKNLRVILSHDWVELGKVTVICAVDENHLQLVYADICRAVGDSYHTCMHSDVNNRIESFVQWEDRVKKCVTDYEHKELFIPYCPEIFLHPKYQVNLIRIILETIKDMDQNLVVLTQSPYILEAVEVYSKRFGFDDFKAILIEDNEDDVYIASDCTNNTDMIYKTFSEHFQLLEDVRSECEGE